MEEMGGEVDKWIFLLMVEYGEVGQLFLDLHPDGAVLRGCAFLEHLLYELVDWKSYLRFNETETNLSFARLINIATYDNEQFISHTERKLLHYVRQIRNDIAHHSWLEKDYTYDAVFTAARVLIYLIGELVEREAVEAGVDFPENTEDIDPQSEYLSMIEDKYEWKYNETKHYWRAKELDEMPFL